MSQSIFDENADGIEELDLQEMADADRPYGEVTAEDLSTDDLIQDGADLATSLGETDADLEGVIPLDHEIDLERDADPRATETIEDRLRQEEPDPASAIVADPRS